MPERNTIPKLRKHKASGQAVVVLNGRSHYLGKHGTAEAREAYTRTIAEWLQRGRRPAVPTGSHDGGITVSQIIDRYWSEHVTGYYRKHGRPTKEQAHIRVTMRSLLKHYGRSPAREFGPLALKAVRQSLIDAPDDYSRTYINDQIGRIKRLFKWAVANELVPPAVHQSLSAVDGLRAGRSAARETDPVQPVSDEFIEAVKPHVSRQVAALIELQRITGMRSSELVAMRGCDIDMSGELWEYRPAEHKTEHHNRERIVPLGPRARAIIGEFLKPDLGAHLFSPADADEDRRVADRIMRKSKVTPSQGKRGARARRRMLLGQRGRAPKDCYTPGSYGRAIKRGCEKAWPVPKGLNDEQARAWRKEHHWFPHQLRHRSATDVRKSLGLEAAQTWLGHSHARVTELYAERNLGVARDIARRIG